MAINFPNSPSNGDTHVVGSKTFVYNSTTTSWSVQGSASVDITSITGDILPDTDSSRSLGSASKKWKDLYISGDTISLGSIKLRDNNGSLKVETSAGADVSGGIKVYANLAAFPSSGNTAGDMGFATDTKAVYIWDGTEWDRIYSGPQEMVEWSTASNSSYNLIIGDSSTTISPVATDPDGFGITYDYLTNPSNPSSATIVQGTGANTNDFSITPDSATIGNFSLRITASDGVSKVSTVSAISITTPPLLTGALTNGLVAFYDAADAQSYSGTGSTWSDISGNGNHLTLATDGSMVYNSSGTGSRPSFTLGKSSANAHVFEQFSSSHNYNGSSYVPVFFVAILRHPISQNGYGQAGFIGRPQGTTPMLELHDFSQYTYYATSSINNSNGAQGGDIANVGSPGSQLFSDWWIDGTQVPETISGLTISREQYQIAMELDGTSGPAGSYSVDATKRDQFHSLMVSNIRLESGIRAAHSAAKPPTGIELRALAIYNYIPTDANKIAIHNVYQNLYGADMASAP
jgi:hypothetical protein